MLPALSVAPYIPCWQVPEARAIWLLITMTVGCIKDEAKCDRPCTP